MTITARVFVRALLMASALVSPVSARAAENRAAESKVVPSIREATSADDPALRAEGEKRFQANCGRCHQFPHKFSPRVILTVERHMRVRALVSEDDMRAIIRYLTQ